MAERRRPIEPSALKKRRQRRRNLRFLFWLILILVLFSTLVLVSRLSAVRIQTINVAGNSLVSSDNIKSTVQNDLVGNYFLLFPKSNVLLYPKGKIKNDILGNYQALSDVSTSLHGLQSLEVKVSERKPEALWCRDVSLEATSSECYFIDQSGYIFYPAPIFSGNTYFIYYGLLASSSPVGQNYLSPTDFQKLQNFIAEVKKLGLGVDSLNAVDYADLSLHLSSGGEILFGLYQSLDQALSNLETVTDKNNPSGNFVDLSQVQYVNLHLGNQVIYKLK